MATMPGETQQEKPRGQPNEGQEGKVRESTKHQFPTGHQSPGGAAIQPGQTYETPEPKRRAEQAGSQQEPNANPERPEQHQPGYEQKQQKAGKREGERQDDANRRSQADDRKAEIEADDDKDALHTQKANRTRSSASKQHVKRGNPALKPGFKPTKKRIRKHK